MASRAALKAVLVNRVGDYGFLLALLGFIVALGGTGFIGLMAYMPYMGFQGCIGLILLALASMGKSAQLGLHSWLADAMEGPTGFRGLIWAFTGV